MTTAEFDELAADMPCKYCGEVGKLRRGTGSEQAERGVWCRAGGCDRHQFWCSKPGNDTRIKRPALKRGTRLEAWGNGSCCVLCNEPREVLDALGVELQVQHWPPFCEAGHDAELLPVCAWCHQFGTSQMKRIDSLVDRLADQFGEPFAAWRRKRDAT
jgi:hypothetical protein